MRQLIALWVTLLILPCTIGAACAQSADSPIEMESAAPVQLAVPDSADAIDSLADPGSGQPAQDQSSSTLIGSAAQPQQIQEQAEVEQQQAYSQGNGGNSPDGTAPTPECIAQASQLQEIPEPVILSIMRTEGGAYGTASLNTNGSYDLGFMQINNQAWVARLALDELGKDTPQTEEAITDLLLFDPCYNINTGSYILRLYAEQAGFDYTDAASWGSPAALKAIGWYNSHDPIAMRSYQAKFARNLAFLFRAQLSNSG